MFIGKEWLRLRVSIGLTQMTLLKWNTTWDSHISHVHKFYGQLIDDFFLQNRFIMEFSKRNVDHYTFFLLLLSSESV